MYEGALKAGLSSAPCTEMCVFVSVCVCVCVGGGGEGRRGEERGGLFKASSNVARAILRFSIMEQTGPHKKKNAWHIYHCVGSVAQPLAHYRATIWRCSCATAHK